MSFLQKSKRMKKSKLSRKKRGQNQKTHEEETNGNSQMPEPEATTVSESGAGDVSVLQEETRKLQEENQYLKLLLGVSFKIDQLYEIWQSIFPNAFSNQNTLKTYLELHSKQKQSDLIIKTFQHVETIKHFLTDHKSQMIGDEAIAVTSNNQNRTLADSSNGNPTSASVEIHSTLRNMSLASSSGLQSPSAPTTLPSPLASTSLPNLTSSLTKRQRSSLGRMMSTEVRKYTLSWFCSNFCVSGPHPTKCDVSLQGNVHERM